MDNNYYEVLELDKSCSKEDIKKKYKKLALLYHPDKNQEEGSSDKFHKITEAYNTLYDDDKRKNYDLYGTRDDSDDPFETFNNIFNEHLSNFMNMGMNYEKDININNILNNLTGINNFNIPDVHLKFQTYQKNDNIGNKNIDNKENKDDLLFKPDSKYIDIDVDLEDIYNKKEKEVKISRSRKKNNKFVIKEKKVNIFLYDDEILLEGLGDEIENYKLKGDVVINLNMKEHEYFRRINEYDLLYFKEISLKEYYNGLEYDLCLPNDEKIKIMNEDFDLNGNNIQILKSYGIPHKKKEKWVYGDLYIFYKVIYPSKEELYDFVEEVYDEEKEIEYNKDTVVSRNCQLSNIF